MPRASREHVAGGMFHVTARGNRRQQIFTDGVDGDRFLSDFADVVERSGWRCHAYCLMPNHYHLLIDMPSPTLSIGMHRLNTRYAQWFNRRHSVDGHLFKDRFHSVSVESDAHLLQSARYIVLNPVVAGLCGHPAGWTWSSYRAMVGGSRPSFLTVDWLLALFGSELEASRDEYERFVLGEPPGANGHGWGTVPETWPD
jgi:putative transposase